MNDENGKMNIFLLQQIEDCRDRNDTVLQITLDPTVSNSSSSPSNSSSTSQSQSPLNELKTLLDDEFVKLFTLTSSTEERIFSAVGCTPLTCLKIIANLRKKQWSVFTSNAYLDIYTNCVVKTFYFEREKLGPTITSSNSGSTLSALTFSPANIITPTISNSSNGNGNGNVVFSPRNNLLSQQRRPSASNSQRSNSFIVDPLFNSSSSTNPTQQESSLLPPSQSQPIMKSTITSPLPPPSVSASTPSSTRPMSTSSSSSPSPSSSSAAAAAPTIPPARVVFSSNAVDPIDEPPKQQQNLPVRRDSGIGSRLRPPPPPPSSASRPRNNSIVAGDPLSTDFPSSPAKPSYETKEYSTQISYSPQPAKQPSTTFNDYSNQEESYSRPTVTAAPPPPPPPAKPLPPRQTTPVQEQKESVPVNTSTASDPATDSDFSYDNMSSTSSAPAEITSGDSFQYSSPLSLKGVFGGVKNNPTVETDSTPAQKNAEYFKRLKEAQELEKQRVADEEARMNASELQRKREAETQAQQHEQSKAAHYARLGGTFVNRGSPLLGGGRGASAPGRTGGRTTGRL